MCKLLRHASSGHRKCLELKPFRLVWRMHQSLWNTDKRHENHTLSLTHSLYRRSLWTNRRVHLQPGPDDQHSRTRPACRPTRFGPGASSGRRRLRNLYLCPGRAPVVGVWSHASAAHAARRRSPRRPQGKAGRQEGRDRLRKTRLVETRLVETKLVKVPAPHGFLAWKRGTRPRANRRKRRFALSSRQ